MRPKCFKLHTDTRKVLILEYNQLVAYFVKVIRPDSWPTLNGARHRGSLNVLFRDGHVEPFIPAEVDPTVPNFIGARWVPTALVK